MASWLYCLYSHDVRGNNVPSGCASARGAEGMAIDGTVVSEVALPIMRSVRKGSTAEFLQTSVDFATTPAINSTDGDRHLCIDGETQASRLMLGRYSFLTTSKFLVWFFLYPADWVDYKAPSGPRIDRPSGPYRGLGSLSVYYSTLVFPNVF